MNAMIYNPQEEFDSKYRELHQSNTEKHLEALVAQSGVDIEANRKTVKEHSELSARLAKLKKKLGLWKVLRVLACITLILIPVAIWVLTPKIKTITAEAEASEQKLGELMSLAHAQMAPLNALFTDGDALKIIETTIPALDFASCLSIEQETDMVTNYDFEMPDNVEQSTTDVLAGRYNGNPFLFESKLIHQMGLEIYHGYKTISWTESYRGSDGKRHTRIRTETLHATVTKPKPLYSTQVQLHYCAQGGPDLSFTRDATALHTKSEKEIDRYVKKGEKKLKKMTDKAIKNNEDFMSMSNSDFEVLFDALDRTNEVQFRTLFTPLAQTNMVDLIRSQSGFGDDFDFIKRKRANRIVTKHSQGRGVNLPANTYYSHAYDTIRANFIGRNTAFFKAVYFDFAPLWAIPMYQDRPVHSLDPLPDYGQKYSLREYEALSNRLNPALVVHPDTKTPAILKSAFVESKNNVDKIAVSAYSYDICQRVDFVSVHGGDGRWHNVAVPWDDYLPLKACDTFFVAADSPDANRDVAATRNQLCIFQ